VPPAFNFAVPPNCPATTQLAGGRFRHHNLDGGHAYGNELSDPVKSADGESGRKAPGDRAIARAWIGTPYGPPSQRPGAAATARPVARPCGAASAKAPNRGSRRLMSPIGGKPGPRDCYRAIARQPDRDRAGSIAPATSRCSAWNGRPRKMRHRRRIRPARSSRTTRFGAPVPTLIHAASTAALHRGGSSAVWRRPPGRTSFALSDQIRMLARQCS